MSHFEGIKGASGANNVNSIGNMKAQGNNADLSTPNQINISEQANYMYQLSELPEIRQEKVDQVKAQIADGTYLNEADMEKAVENMLQDLI